MKLSIQRMRKIGERIRWLRKRMKLTQERLAELSGYTPGYIGSIENARKVPSMPFLFDIASALDTSPSDLLIDARRGPDRDKIKAQIQELIDQL